MSQENVEAVVGLVRGWNEAGLDGMLPFFHEDIEYRPIEERGAVHGHDGLRRYFERWMESWEVLTIALTEIASADDLVFNGLTVDGRGRGSGADVTMKYWQVWHFRDRRATRWEEYLDRAEALEAVGLSE
jgi:ketosteroid isomerase-like protein